MIKDKITRSDKPEDLQELIILIIKINNYIYKYNLKKQG